MVRRAVGRGHVRKHQPGPEHASRLHQVVQGRGARGLGVREDHVHTKARRVSGEDFQVPVWRKSPGLTGLRDEVQHHQAPGGRGAQGGGEPGHQQVRQHAGEPRAGAEHDPVRVEHGAHGLGHRGRIGRH